MAYSKEHIVFPVSKNIFKEDYRRQNARKVNKSKNPNGFLYILWNESLNLIKIGVSNSPKRRIRDIKSYSPFDLDLVLLKYYEDVYSLEKMVHDKWQNNRIKGEWFQGHKNDLLQTIKILKEVK